MGRPPQSPCLGGRMERRPPRSPCLGGRMMYDGGCLMDDVRRMMCVVSLKKQ